MWELYQLSKAYGSPPADIIGLTDGVAAYGLNRAVFLFGTSLENQIAEETAKLTKDSEIRARTDRVLQKWLAKPGEEPKGQFRDPAVG